MQLLATIIHYGSCKELHWCGLALTTNHLCQSVPVCRFLFIIISCSTFQDVETEDINEQDGRDNQSVIFIWVFVSVYDLLRKEIFY